MEPEVLRFAYLFQLLDQIGAHVFVHLARFQAGARFLDAILVQDPVLVLPVGFGGCSRVDRNAGVFFRLQQMTDIAVVDQGRFLDSLGLVHGGPPNRVGISERRQRRHHGGMDACAAGFKPHGSPAASHFGKRPFHGLRGPVGWSVRTGS
jgi:hypothetical protein